MKRLGTIRVVGAIITGAMLSTVGATAASAVPVSSVSSVSVQPGAVGRGSIGTVSALPSAASGQQGPQGENSTNRVSIGTIVTWIKNNAPSIISGMKSAIRGGINNFKNWWNGLSGWIRAGISAISQMSVNELFSALWNYFFG
ncbi:hypothetical protein DEI99_015670 [Curtobacterium sp. MCLR17_036]|uniref:hypothetical protein n=1 Tax=Curtobacterium sp. MCLR17_036 TaxID=2175620 RepID=UPI000DAA656D|nr:hypothetical protein [Curtobacterium sp. MCLR17_036]WIE64650.1 hypothetical protein DEI99_015670 [Curtobacterium sp. MCLR17_036]